jgi:hypothetical protein
VQGVVTHIDFEAYDGTIVLGGSKERRRFLEHFQGSLSPALQEELETLRIADDASSVSTISMTTYSMPEELRPFMTEPLPELCGSDCWLKIGESSSQSSVVAGVKDLGQLDTDPTKLYAPLKPSQTRILCLHPGASETQVQCSLIPMSLDGPSGGKKDQGWSGEYEALSYTWGKPHPTTTLTCNGVSHSVTDNLYSALHHLRSPDRPRYIWIDALCINQNDIPERNVQVREMIRIYSGAKRVVIWLGGAAADSEWAMSFITQLDQLDNRKQILGQAHTELCLANLNRYYNALLALYNRQWFRRTWIRQEVAVAQRLIVHCGHSSASWCGMKRAARRLNVIHKKISNESSFRPAHPDTVDTDNLRYLTKQWRLGQPALRLHAEEGSLYRSHMGTLLDLLMLGRAFDATDPRDKVYALLGLANEPMGDRPDLSLPTTFEPMVIDYASTVSEVYQRLVKYIINCDGNLDILCILSTHRGPESRDLPSWTADWRFPTFYAGLTECWDYLSMPFAATGDSKAEYQRQDKLGTLVGKGYMVDTVSSLLDVTTTAGGLLNIASTMNRRTKRFDAGTYHSNTKPYNDGRDFRRCCVGGRSGRICLVPSGSRQGDIMFLLQGARLPLVLRYLPHQAEGDRYVLRQNSEFELLGPCLIPGYTHRGDWNKVLAFARSQNGQLVQIKLV